MDAVNLLRRQDSVNGNCVDLNQQGRSFASADLSAVSSMLALCGGRLGKHDVPTA